MKTFDELPDTEKTLLLQYPAYISLLAANADMMMDASEKAAALKLTHIKTFSTEPLLHPFYKAAEAVFEKNIDLLDKTLPQGKEERDEAITRALHRVNTVLQKLGIDYAGALRRSMKSYKNHISKAHRNVLEYFLFPLPIDGISD